MIDVANIKEVFGGKEDCQEVQTKDIGLKWKTIVVEIFAF